MSWRQEKNDPSIVESCNSKRVIANLLLPQITYLNSVVMPDEPESESDGDDSEESSSGDGSDASQD